MKNQKIGADTHKNQVYVLTANNVTNTERLLDTLKQYSYNFFTTSEGSEPFHQIQDETVGPQVSLQQNDSAPNFREKSLPGAEEVPPSEMLLSREQLHGNYDDIIGESPRHLEVLKSIDRFAKSSKPVLISGETGTGKELVARALHTESPYAIHPMVVVNCAGLAEHLMESELFGHEKGAFTSADRQHIGLFETALGSTLFLDEIGELPMPLQPKLLRVLQENEMRRGGGTKQIPVTARVLAATNIDLIEAIAAGRFRRDLYERLKSLHIQLPALWERREDIPALAKHFLTKENNASSRKVANINPAVLSLFNAYTWPGNIRELEGVIGHAVLLAEEGEILPHHLPLDLQTPRAHALSLADATTAVDPNAAECLVLPFLMGTTLQEIEKSAILATLARENGNKSKTAAVLGISRVTLNIKLRTYSGEA